MQGSPTILNGGSEVRRGSDDVHAQCGIAHEGNVDLSGAIILLIAIEAIGTIVLSKASAVTNGSAQRHMMHKPMGVPRTHAGQAVAGQSKGGPLKIVFGVPIAKPTAEKHRESRFGIIPI